MRLSSTQLVLISSDRADVKPYGPLEVTDGPDGIVVTERVPSGEERPTGGLDVPTNSVVEIQSELGGLTVRHFQGFLRARMRHGATRIESSSGRFRIVASYGSVTVDHVRGPVDVLSTTGSVNVRRLQGEVQAVSDGGRVDLEDVDGPVVARSTTGSIKVIDLKGTTRLSTRSGAVTVEGMRGQLTVRTQSGDLSLDASVVAHTTLETQKGRIEVRLGPETDARIEASARQGVVRSERIQLSPGSGRRTIRGRLREGRARLQVTTGMGVIEISGPARRLAAATSGTSVL